MIEQGQGNRSIEGCKELCCSEAAITILRCTSMKFNERQGMNVLVCFLSLKNVVTYRRSKG